MPNGKCGDLGPHVAPLAVRDLNSELGRALEHSLEVTSNVLGNLARLGNARQQSVQVFYSEKCVEKGVSHKHVF